uniref:Uncharacterized protein n=1 Tax=Hyaloperonospora arabidopsidis (strain Emoy2) TaxID=559515 RepID=M4BVI0_HYAAE
MKNLDKCIRWIKIQDLSAVDDDQDEVCEVIVTCKLSVKTFPRSRCDEVTKAAMVTLSLHPQNVSRRTKRHIDACVGVLT